MSILRRWKVVALTTIVVLALALAYTSTARKDSAQATPGQEAPTPAVSASTPSGEGSSSDSRTIRVYVGDPSGQSAAIDLASEAEIVASVDVAKRVAEITGVQTEELLEGVRVASVGTRVLDISWEGEDEDSEAIALAFAKQYLKRRDLAINEASAGARADLNRQLEIQVRRADEIADNLRQAAGQGDLETAELLRAELAAAYVLSGNLSAELSELRANSRASAGGFILGPRASTAVAPSSAPTDPTPAPAPALDETPEVAPPSYLRNGIAGLTLGGILGSLLALLLAWLDPRFRDQEHAVTTLSTPLLADLRLRNRSSWPDELRRVILLLRSPASPHPLSVCLASTSSSGMAEQVAGAATESQEAPGHAVRFSHTEDISHSSSALQEAAEADGTILLIDLERTDRADVSRVINELAAIKSPVLGVITVRP